MLSYNTHFLQDPLINTGDYW